MEMFLTHNLVWIVIGSGIIFLVSCALRSRGRFGSAPSSGWVLFAVVVGLALDFGSTPVSANRDGHLEATHDSSFGRPGEPALVARTVELDAADTMRLTPPRISVGKGETIRFVVRNPTPLEHELVLDRVKELRAHAELMSKCPEMERGSPNWVNVQPGKTGELIWQFTKAGDFDFACLQPGHFAGGANGRIVVK